MVGTALPLLAPFSLDRRGLCYLKGEQLPEDMLALLYDLRSRIEVTCVWRHMDVA